MTFGERLSDLRKLNQYTQADMARFLGMTQQGYSKIEYNQREANYEKLIILSELFQVSVDYLLRGTEVREASFGEKLIKLRKLYKVSQEDLAENLGIDLVSISQYELNDQDPTFEHLRKIAKHFKVTSDYLLGID
jgi:transcriptional regulator with XRE-family HTH domain